jgi:hypothetical protein
MDMHSPIGRPLFPSRILRSLGWVGCAALFGAGAAQAACTVNGVVGAPIVNDAQIVCSGANTTPIITTATGVSLTLTPGASLVVPAGNQAIVLGAGAILDLQVGSLVSGAPSSSSPLIIVSQNSVVFVSGSITSSGGSPTVLRAGADTVLAVYGSISGAMEGGAAQSLIYSGANVSQVFWVRYTSSAGTVGNVEFTPAFSNQEFYNEAGGAVNNGVYCHGTMASPVGGAPAQFDCIVVNRGYIGPWIVPGTGQPIALNVFNIVNTQFTNEASGVVNGDVFIARGYRTGASFGINHGIINGTVILNYASDDMPTANPYGVDQRFDNYGALSNVTIYSGRYVQRATGTFASGATLRVSMMRSDGLAGQFLGTAEIAGTHAVSCLLGGEDLANGRPGGVLDLSSGAVLTILPVASQSCSFNGTIIGAGRFIKNGAGTQRVGGPAELPPGWDLVRPATSYSGGTEIKAGTLEVVTSDALGTGAVQFTGVDARLLAGADALNLPNALQFPQQAVIDSGANTFTLSGATSGSAVVRKLGSGVLVWPGARGHSGQTRVEAGTLRLSGNLAGPLRGYSGATIEGQANVSGALVLDAGATLRVRIGAGGVNGFAASTATLAGNLELVEDASPPLGTTSVLLAVGGSAPASGIFAGRPEGSRIDIGGSAYRISYQGGDGNDVTLKRIAPLLAPTNVVATPGNTSISLSFDPPPPTGETISGYRATCTPGNVVVEGPASPLAINGLSNGTPYSCDLVALGVDGPGAAATVGATPRTVPGAPRDPVGAGPSGILEVAFQPPLSDGGAAIQSYTLTCLADGTWQFTDTTSPLRILGVPDAQLYSCSVVATNAAGSGPASASVEIMPGVVPTTVRNLFVANGNGTAGIDFQAPMIGAPILDYRALCQPGDVAKTSATPPLLLTGLSNGVTYTCDVTARNAIGRGPAVQATLKPTAVLFADGFE